MSVTEAPSAAVRSRHGECATTLGPRSERNGLEGSFAGPLTVTIREVVMSEKTVAEKARIKPGTTIAVLNPAPGVVESLGLPEGITFVQPTQAQLVFLFVNTHAELEAQMPPVIAGLAPGAAIWVFYRRGSRAAGLDMNRDDVWAIAETMDLRPLGLVGIDDTWSAFRLRPAR